MLNVIFVCVVGNERELKMLWSLKKDWLIVYLMYTNYCMFIVISYYSIYLIYCFNSIFNEYTDFRFWILFL